MKVCIINNLYPPYTVGGAERIVEEQTKKLLAGGNKVIIITSRPWKGWGSFKPEAGKDGEAVIYRVWQPNIFWYKNLNKHNFFWKLIWHGFDIFNPLVAHWVGETLEKEKPDEVWTHNLMGLSYKVHKVIKFIKSNVKWRHFLHDVQLVEPSGVLPWDHVKDKWHQKIYSWLIKKQLRTPDVVVALSKFIENFYWSRGFFQGAKWRVDGGLRTSDFGLRTAAKQPKAEVRFLFVGSLVEHKGIEVLMRAWDELCHCEEANSYRLTKQSKVFTEIGSLYIVGSGILESEIREWAKNFKNVNVCGRLEGEDLKKVYENCDILIFPSICLENRPTVILEALQHGLLVIASDTGGVRELVKPNENTWLFTPGNVEELVKRMKRFV